MITSLLPLITSVGWRIDFRYSNGFSRGAPHLLIAPIWAGATFSLTSGSRFSARSRNRLRNSLPAAWLFSDFVKCTRSEEHTSELQSHLNLVCRLLLEKKKK